MKQLIVEVNELIDFDTESLPLELGKAILNLRIKVPTQAVIGTKIVSGKRLILLMSPLNKYELETFANVGYVSGQDELGDDIVQEFNLAWTVLAEEGVTVNQAPLLVYMEDTIDLDEFGEPTGGTTPVTDITGKLHTYYGHSWSY